MVSALQPGEQISAAHPVVNHSARTPLVGVFVRTFSIGSTEFAVIRTASGDEGTARLNEVVAVPQPELLTA